MQQNNENNLKKDSEKLRKLYDVFENEIKSSLITLEILRQKELKNIGIKIAVTFSLCVIYIPFLLFTAIEQETKAGIILLSIPLLVLMTLGHSYAFQPMNKNKDFILNLKRRYLNEVIKIFGDIKWIDTEENKHEIAACDIFKSSIIPQYKKYECLIGDVFTGSYLGIDYNIIKVNAQDGYNKIPFDRDWRPVLFSGVLAELKLKNKIKHDIIILTKHVNDKYGAIEGKTRLKNYKFENIFSVYCEDENEAKTLLTPAFMEQLYNLKTNYGTDNLKCEFCDDKLFIAIKMNIAFYIFQLGNLFYSLLDKSIYKKLFNHINPIFNIIECLKLNE